MGRSSSHIKTRENRNKKKTTIPETSIFRSVSQTRYSSAAVSVFTSTPLAVSIINEIHICRAPPPRPRRYTHARIITAPIRPRTATGALLSRQHPSVTPEHPPPYISQETLGSLRVPPIALPVSLLPLSPCRMLSRILGDGWGAVVVTTWAVKGRTAACKNK